MPVDIDDDDSALFVSFSGDFKIVRVIDNTFVPSHISFKCDILPSEEAAELDLHKAMTKIRYWLDNIVSKSVMFCSSNTAALSMLIENGKNRSGNVLMITPFEPTDEMLACILQSKMTALAAGDAEFDAVEVTSDNYLGLSFMFTGTASLMLPTIEEWIGPRHYFDKPWWARNDASTLDVVPVPDADLAKTPDWAFSLDDLDDPKPKTGIVVRPEFKPTIIDGGKPK